MNTQSTQTPIDRAQPVGFIDFRQRHLLVVSHQSVLNFEITEYIEAKLLVEATKFSWEAAQTVLKRPDVRALCGKKELLPPEIATETAPDQPNNPRLYLCLEDVLLFLARLSTDGLHEEIDHGAVTDALILQDQWAKALRRYQTQAMALRLWQRSGIDELIHPEPKRPRSKPTMIQELELIQALSEHGKSRNHAHCCRCHRQIGQHSHG